MGESLEDELGIPPNATLNTSHNKPVHILIITSQDINTNFITIASSSHSTNNNHEQQQEQQQSDERNGVSNLSTEISSQSSLRGINARCLIIGRQASSADVRVDHKSVSRRHTALYYTTATNNINGKDNSEEEEVVLTIQDLGGKHGTYVNDTRLEKNGCVHVPLVAGGESSKTKEYNVRIGNAPLICRLVMNDTAVNSGDNTKKLDSKTEQDGDRKEPAPETKITSQTSMNANQDAHIADEIADTKTNDNNEDDDVLPSTRESREAQIAAMMASFDTAPTYKKYIPPEDEDGRNDNIGVAEGMMSNLNTDNNSTTNSHCNTQTSSRNNNKYNLPITNSITLTPKSNSFASSDGTNTPLQAKASVTTLCFEPSGARLVAGHRDGTLRFYDFHGMQQTSESSRTNTYPPFRIVDSDNDPLDETGRHVITSLSPSSSGGQWIVGNTSAQAKVLDREGQITLFYFIKGDVYVTDPSKTSGHTASVTGVAFHPLIKDVCWTTGLDGSVRQWDTSGKGKTQFKKLVCKVVIAKVKNSKGQRTQVVSNVSVHPNGRKLVIGTSCGSIQIWNCFGNNLNARPLGAVYCAHGSGNNKPVTFVTFSGSGERIASRSADDDTVRIWDVARIEKETGSTFGTRKRDKEGEHSPSVLLAVCNGLPALNESANCAFSPDGMILCAGTSVDPRAMNKTAQASGGSNDTFCGKLKFYKLPEETKRSKSSSKEACLSSKSLKNKITAMLEPIVELDVAPNASILGVQWHPKLNQIAIGTSNGM